MTVKQMTARQLKLYYNEAVLQQAEDYATQLDALSIAFVGKPSEVANNIRETL